jgi:hypothetical protein
LFKEKTISKSSLMALLMHLSISETFLNGEVVGTETIKLYFFLAFKYLIACFHDSISEDLSVASFTGRIKGTWAPFFMASLAIILLSVLTTTSSIYLDC